MIDKETVLILGAGASMDFNFPSGRILKNRVIERCIAAPNALFHDILVDLNTGITENDISDFGNALKNSGQQSVDRFLERQKKFMDVGKAAIALVLMDYESPAQLFNTDDNSHWYEHLWNKLSGKLDEFGLNKLNVITFNYDRSFEFYLTTSLANTHGIELDDAYGTIQTMAIIHVHGQLGKLSFGETNERMRVYEPGNGSTALPSCLGDDGIKIISETEADSEEFVSARKLINCAERIIFLGLAYDHTNLYRLGMLHPPPIDKNNSNIEITGSSYDLTENQCNIIEDKFDRHILLRADGYGKKVLEFLRETVPFD